MKIYKCPIWDYSNADKVTEYGPTVNITQNNKGYEINSQKQEVNIAYHIRPMKNLKQTLNSLKIYLKQNSQLGLLIKEDRVKKAQESLLKS